MPTATARVRRPLSVSGVTFRSPFRYPGGKTWLAPVVEDWVRHLGGRRHFLEPFAGGASVALAIAATRAVWHTDIVELDDDVAAVWRTTLTGDLDELIARIRAFTPTPEDVAAVASTTPVDDVDRAFATLVRNRTSRGGVMAARAGTLNRGERGRGVASRWYPGTLATRLEAIRGMGDRIAFTHGDGVAVLSAAAGDPDLVAFVDPPYTAGGAAAGRRLYRHCELDHAGVFAAVAAVDGHVLVTYDDALEVRDLAAAHGLACVPVTMRGNQAAPRHELLLVRDPKWFLDRLR